MLLIFVVIRASKAARRWPPRYVSSDVRSGRSSPRATASGTAGADVGTKTAIIVLSLEVENNSKFVRGKKRAREDIELILREYSAVRRPGASTN